MLDDHGVKMNMEKQVPQHFKSLLSLSDASSAEDLTEQDFRGPAPRKLPIIGLAKYDIDEGPSINSPPSQILIQENHSSEGEESLLSCEMVPKGGSDPYTSHRHPENNHSTMQSNHRGRTPLVKEVASVDSDDLYRLDMMKDSNKQEIESEAKKATVRGRPEVGMTTSQRFAGTSYRVDDEFSDRKHGTLPNMRAKGNGRTTVTNERIREETRGKGVNAEMRSTMEGPGHEIKVHEKNLKLKPRHGVVKNEIPSVEIRKKERFEMNDEIGPSFDEGTSFPSFDEGPMKAKNEKTGIKASGNLKQMSHVASTRLNSSFPRKSDQLESTQPNQLTKLEVSTSSPRQVPKRAYPPSPSYQNGVAQHAYPPSPSYQNGVAQHTASKALPVGDELMGPSKASSYSETIDLYMANTKSRLLDKQTEELPTTRILGSNQNVHNTVTAQLENGKQVNHNYPKSPEVTARASNTFGENSFVGQEHMRKQTGETGVQKAVGSNLNKQSSDIPMINKVDEAENSKATYPVGVLEIQPTSSTLFFEAQMI